MNDQQPDPAEEYERGRREVYDLLQNEAQFPRPDHDRESWKRLIDDLISSMRSNDVRPR